MNHHKLWLSLKSALVSVLFCSGAHAVTLSATALDLPDTVVGEDLWQLNYTLGGSLASFNGVNLIFPFADFSGLDLITSPAPDLSAALSPTDAASSFDGLLTLTAQSDLPTSYTTTFSVNFTKLTAQALSPQSFEVFDDSFNVVDSGTLSINVGLPPVPEPSTLALLSLGAVFMVCMQRRRSGAA